LVTNYSLRQIGANILLLAYPAVYIFEHLRFIGSFDLLPYVPKIVTALFFILSMFVWKNILEELKLSRTATLFFFFIVLTSGWYLVFGKFIPLLGGYLFYTSLCWLFFLKWLRTNALGHLILSFFFLILVSFTHIFSVLLVPLSLLILVTISVVKKEISFGKIVKHGVGALVVVLLAVGVLLS